MQTVLQAHVVRTSQHDLMDSSFAYVFCAIGTMATMQQTAHTVLWYAKFESNIQVQVHLDMSMV
jgi:hypothetical protein